MSIEQKGEREEKRERKSEGEREKRDTSMSYVILIGAVIVDEGEFVMVDGWLRYNCKT